MAEIKYQFDGIARFNATLIFTALASTGWGAPLTTGLLGKLVFFFLKKFGNWFANQGLALLNIGIDHIKIASEKSNYEQVFAEALAEVQANKNKLTPAQRKAIDDKVKRAARHFIHFV